MRRCGLLFIAILILTVTVSAAMAQSGSRRFPPPDFESGYEMPATQTPAPEPAYRDYAAAALLAAVLALGVFLVYKKRTRNHIWVLMLFSLAVFGFWRRGCICPIGATQNMALTVFDSGYAASMAVILIFLLPLALSLFFGRVFCGTACPLGALQDVVLFKPVSVPGWVEAPLRLAGYIYLGLALTFVVTGAGFIICRYDPFVAFFRLSGSAGMLALGIAFLLTGVFIGRPYCRFLCPYGILLRQLSRISRWRVMISPEDCVRCRLCEESCPFGAIHKPTGRPSEAELAGRKKALAVLLVLFVPIILAGAYGGMRISGVLSRAHHDVRLADRVYLEESGQVTGMTDASEAFRIRGGDAEELYADSVRIEAAFSRAALFLGGFIGLVVASSLIYHTVRRNCDDYRADPADCMACGRCYEYCPEERVRRREAQEGGQLIA